MKSLYLAPLLASAAALAGCAMAPAPATVAAAGTCGTYGYVDINNDGAVSTDEWHAFRGGTYSFWDANSDGRISRSEFERCYRAGGFYRADYYNPGYWTNYWTTFDANGDGFLSADEYWSAGAWTRIDRNANGRIDADEWVWWNS